MVQYSKKYSSTVQQLGYRGWHWEKSYWLEEGEEVGDGRAKGLSTVWEWRQAATSLESDIGGTHIHIFESSQLEDLYVEDLLYTYLSF